MKPVSLRELAKWYGDVTGLNGVSFDLQPRGRQPKAK